MDSGDNQSPDDLPSVRAFPEIWRDTPSGRNEANGFVEAFLATAGDAVHRLQVLTDDVTGTGRTIRLVSTLTEDDIYSHEPSDHGLGGRPTYDATRVAGFVDFDIAQHNDHGQESIGSILIRSEMKLSSSDPYESGLRSVELHLEITGNLDNPNVPNAKQLFLSAVDGFIDCALVADGWKVSAHPSAPRDRSRVRITTNDLRIARMISPLVVWGVTRAHTADSELPATIDHEPPTYTDSDVVSPQLAQQIFDDTRRAGITIEWEGWPRKASAMNSRIYAMMLAESLRFHN